VPIDTPRVWLTEQTYDRARVELARLRMERATGSRRDSPTRNNASAGSDNCKHSSAAPPSDTNQPMTASPSPAWC
jgi:hypothetical protein